MFVLIGYRFWLTIIFHYWTISNGCISVSVEEVCRGMDKYCVLNYYKDFRLPRRDPVKIGHITKLELDNGQIRHMKTLSLKPPVFEIANFLTHEECDDIIELAKERGLETSLTMDQDLFEDIKYFADDKKDVFDYYDYDKNGVMDVDEVINLLDTELDFTPDKEDVIRMFQDIKLDKDGDMRISFEEFKQKDVKAFIKFVALGKMDKPYTKSRNSNQTWLETYDNSADVLQSLRRRLHKLTQLPMMLLNASESLQVVSYEARGHYNCHTDSDDVDERKCCHLDNFESSNCRICRYLTVLYYLTDVEEGGETAFPVADNETFDEDVWQKDAMRICNVGRNCHKSNLRVKPEKGKAILWYSHVVDDDTGWLGESDPYSFHGGCDVKKGIKWIANNWISVSENRTGDIEVWLKEQLQRSNEDSDSSVADSVMKGEDDDIHDDHDDNDDDRVGHDDDQILETVEPESKNEKDENLESVFEAIENANVLHDKSKKTADSPRNQRYDL